MDTGYANTSTFTTCNFSVNPSVQLSDLCALWRLWFDREYSKEPFTWERGVDSCGGLQSPQGNFKEIVFKLDYMVYSGSARLYFGTVMLLNAKIL